MEGVEIKGKVRGSVYCSKFLEKRRLLSGIVVLVVQRLGVGLVIERSLVQLPVRALLSQLGQLSLPSLRGR